MLNPDCSFRFSLYTSTVRSPQIRCSVKPSIWWTINPKTAYFAPHQIFGVVSPGFYVQCHSSTQKSAVSTEHSNHPPKIHQKAIRRNGRFLVFFTSFEEVCHRSINPAYHPQDSGPTVPLTRNLGKIGNLNPEVVIILDYGFILIRNNKNSL